MSDNSIDPVRLIYTFDVNIFGFLMNPDNAILILALVAFILGASMNFLIAGSIIAAVLVIFYYLVVAMKRSQAWPPVKTLCPD